MESREGGNFLLYRIFYVLVFLLVSCSEDGIVHDKEEIFYMPELSCETRGFFWIRIASWIFEFILL